MLRKFGLTFISSVAYGEAASVFLEIDLKSMEKLCALVLYYPDNFSSPGNGFPPHFNVLVHFAESLDFTPSCRYYVYPDVKEGFAATNVKAFDKVAASLAWSRTLATLKKKLLRSRLI